MAKRGRPPEHIWGKDTLDDVRRAWADVKLARPKKWVEQDGIKFLRPLKRGELKQSMAKEPGSRSSKWERRNKTEALLRKSNSPDELPD